MNLNRRKLLKTGLVFAGGSLAASVVGAQKVKAENEQGKGVNQSFSPATAPGRRKLGTLEVSSIGIGVQNMPRTYQTTIPYRPEMINIIRSAYDHGVTCLIRQKRMAHLKVSAYLERR